MFVHMQGRLLSDMSASELARSTKPPRVVHPLVAAGLKQVRMQLFLGIVVL